jgi:hypothetical protein
MNQTFLYKIVILISILFIVVCVSWLSWNVCLLGEEGLTSLNDTDLPKEYSQYRKILNTMSGNFPVGNSASYSLDSLYATVAAIDENEDSLSTIENYANVVKQFYKTMDDKYAEIADGMSSLYKWNQDNHITEIDPRSKKNRIEALIIQYDNSNNFLDNQYNKSVNQLQKKYDTSMNLILSNYHDSLQQADVSYNHNILMYENSPTYTNLGSTDWYHVYQSFPLDRHHSSDDHLLECQNQCNQLDMSCSGIEYVQGALPYCNMISKSTTFGMPKLRQSNINDPFHVVFSKSNQSSTINAAELRNNDYQKAVETYNREVQIVKDNWDLYASSLYGVYKNSKESLTSSVSSEYASLLGEGQTSNEVAIQLSDDDYRKMYQLVAEMRFYIVTVVNDMIPLVKRSLDISPLDFSEIDLESFVEAWSTPLQESFENQKREGYVNSNEQIRFPLIPLNLGEEINAETLQSFPLQPEPVLSESTSDTSSWTASNPIPYKKYANIQYDGSPLPIAGKQNTSTVGPTVLPVGPVDCAMTCSDPTNSCVGFNYDKQKNSCTYFDDFRTTVVEYDYLINKNKDLYYSGTLNIPPQPVYETPEDYDLHGALTNWNRKPGFLHPNQMLLSDSGNYGAYMSPEGNLQVVDVRYGGQKVLWSLKNDIGLATSDLIPDSSMVVSPTGDLLVYDI